MNSVHLWRKTASGSAQLQLIVEDIVYSPNKYRETEGINLGDTNMCTDNPVLLRNSHNPSSILCVQRKAEKRIVTEEDIIQANKLAFNGDIGIVTNHITSMIERRAGFDKDSEEYKLLTYRIRCGQLYQQNTINIGGVL